MDVAIGKETSVAVDNKPLSDAVSAPCTQAAVRGNAAAASARFMAIVYYLTSLKALKKTSNLHENSGTVEYFAGQ